MASTLPFEINGHLIRAGKAKDCETLHKLVMELAKYEKAPEQVETTPEQLREDGFGANPRYELLVAEDLNSGIVRGIALYYPIYSTWKGPVLYLEDLIVTESARGSKLGYALMLGLAQVAAEKGVEDLRWQVLDWNEPARRFYQQLDAKIDTTWDNCRLRKPELRKLTEQLSNLIGA